MLRYPNLDETHGVIVTNPINIVNQTSSVALQLTLYGLLTSHYSSTPRREAPLIHRAVSLRMLSTAPLSSRPLMVTHLWTPAPTHHLSLHSMAPEVVYSLH